MALAAYETLTQALLQAPSSPVPLIPLSTLDVYINQARRQVAAQGRCIRQSAALQLSPGVQYYGFNSVTGLAAGAVLAFYHIRQMWLTIPGVIGLVLMYPRPYEWFALFSLNKLNPPQGQPRRWSQFGQGVQGSLFVDPIPDLPYMLTLDVLGLPVDLVTDATAEAIPDIWTLAVPFYAAWLGFQSLQRQADADKMLERFQQQMALARAAATPNLVIESWSQSPDPEQANRLGVQPRAAQAG